MNRSILALWIQILYDHENPQISFAATERMNGQFSVIDDQLRLYDNGSEGIFKTGLMDISGGVANISMEIQLIGDLEEADYARFYKILDEGEEVLIDEVRGAIVGTYIMKGEASGKNLQLVIRSDVNSSTRSYFFDNIRVDY